MMLQIWQETTEITVAKMLPTVISLLVSCGFFFFLKVDIHAAVSVI